MPRGTFPTRERKPNAIATGLFDNVVEDLCAALLEFIGTTFFLLFALGGIQAANASVDSDSSIATPALEHVLFIALTMAFSLIVAAWLFFRVTGGLFNPNVSLGLFIAGVIGPVRFVLYCIAQLAGGIAAAGLVLALTPGELASNTVLARGVNVAQGVFIEMFITAALVFAVLMLAAEKHQSTPLAPVGIGLTLFAGHLFGVYYTGAAMNTARSFGPAAVTGFKYGRHWVYWVGPFLGSLLASAFYAILKHYRYWRINPGQDTTRFEKSPGDPIENVASQIFSSDGNSASNAAVSGRGSLPGRNKEARTFVGENAV